jgi:uncharacterized membrane protein (DUF106 family)
VDNVASKNDYGTLKLIAFVLILLAMCVIVAVTSVAYIETLWMKNEIKQERKELRKLKKELENHVQSH